MTIRIGTTVVCIDEIEHKTFGELKVVEILDHDTAEEQQRHPILCRASNFPMMFLDFKEDELAVLN